VTLDAARRIAPEQARLATALGLNFLKLGRADDAREAFRAALAIDPADAAARAGLAEPAP
jgi:Flp pilus assembly protein TadD